MLEASKNTRVLGIGDNTVDIYVDEATQYPGGNAVNVAVLAARLGVSASYLGCLGTDARGDLLYDSLNSEHIDLSHCRRRAGPNSFSCVSHRDGDRHFLGSDPGVRYQYELGDADERFIAQHDVAHTSIYSRLEAEMPRIRNAARVLSMDLSEHVDRSGPLILRLLDIAFISCPGDDDLRCRSMAEAVSAAGPSVVVVTRGRRGSLALHRNTWFHQDVIPTEPVDTLGAGDALIAGFLVAQLVGADVAGALREGATYASQACRSKGAFGYGIPWTPDARTRPHAQSAAAR